MQTADYIYHQGFHVIDHFLATTDYHELRSQVDKLYYAGGFKPGKIGHQNKKVQNSVIRNDRISWLNPQSSNSGETAYFNALEQLRNSLNLSLFLGLIDVEAHFAIYQPNAFYKKHIDQFSTTQERRISCVYYLNENWQQNDGGELQLFDLNDQPLATINPIGNRFVCFNSNLPHEVNIAHKTRYSIAAWLKIRPIENFNL